MILNPDHRKDTPGILVGESGRFWLCVVDPHSWNKNGHKHENKQDILYKMGKMLPGGSWEDVLVDITWDDKGKVIIVKRMHCDPFPFAGDTIYVYVS